MIPKPEDYDPQPGSSKPNGDAGGVHSIIQAEPASRLGIIQVLAVMWKSLACALLVPISASAAEMSRVPVQEGFCKGSGESFCFEWAVSSGENLRFIAHGDEDGIEYRFYLAKSGTYEVVSDVFPILQDAAHPDTLFWAYPWDIADIVIVSLNGEPAILATNQHQLKVRDVFGMPVSDEVRQAVMFTGTTTQPEKTVEKLPFRPFPLSWLGNDG